MHFRKAHKRLTSELGPDFSAETAIRPTQNQRPPFRLSRGGKGPLWRRLLRSCVASSNPDVETFKPQEPSQLVEIQQKAAKRASYIPRHAESSFASSTTPLKARDEERKKRQSQIYQQAFLAPPDDSTMPKGTIIGLSFGPGPDAKKDD